MAVERRPIPLQIVYLMIAFAGFMLLSALAAKWLL